MAFKLSCLSRAQGESLHQARAEAFARSRKEEQAVKQRLSWDVHQLALAYGRAQAPARHCQACCRLARLAVVARAAQSPSRATGLAIVARARRLLARPHRVRCASRSCAARSAHGPRRSRSWTRPSVRLRSGGSRCRRSSARRSSPSGPSRPSARRRSRTSPSRCRLSPTRRPGTAASYRASVTRSFSGSCASTRM